MPGLRATGGRRTKIVCTLGPATDSVEAITALVQAGMDVARLNFSHGTADEHAARYLRVREASAACGRRVGILADLQGPKVRLGRFVAGGALLEPGSLFTITTDVCEGTAERASTTYAGLPGDVHGGEPLLIDDGRLLLSAERSEGTDIACRVIDGGLVSDHKGINVPGVRLGTPALTAKDAEDLRFAVALGVDLVALSFVRGPEDAAEPRRVMESLGRQVPLIAKLENAAAVEHLDGVVEAFDGLMVARGDLGVEVPLEKVPLIQKRAVARARARSKPVIVATQMLESMIQRSRPTRAEASDIANAVLDGTDALMLSGETSVGQHAAGAVATMARIICAAEEERFDNLGHLDLNQSDHQEAITRAAPEVGRLVGARVLVAFTQTGATARRLASQRSSIPLLALTPDPSVSGRLSLSWGVESQVVPDSATNLYEMVDQVERSVLRSGHAGPGDAVVIIAGSPSGRAGTTNLMRVHTLGDA